ncbi:MAG: 30S ribosomal protein S4 [Bdellovibrionales bacterium RIFOXYD12_FULL_39_22]|nr:MAG: 30S ribosomal protein S4 [Bdellovibrionales bacterium RIFOXYB1_FULL_39_21]OFZ43361.1 MAG: 30S ribosomal protein S4 [Bdellovibrionales bacterium RIFOXYC12_FULL_39_17]OFZ47414.1 MAG: 30S ribosomal protein S4 [Bdellovibrionales bacterium RIFOXYC1_FULL_39_130]OFZ76294.1 MAG: 30S ribosomal protein S4 [Bdellovibrionales bacterium RIFOXYD1_FULL_39_84]OFZ94332.1 MAG: 30S ribosomal protein S4 [Bdellovibrionales bacterium RIFOXYD12_FULL_39_22]HLE12059.1 30S ribosomal protein S4 [Bacteriovoracace
MSRHIGSVCKLCRRESEKLFLKGSRCYTDKCAIERRGYPPGQHGQRRAKISDFGVQLREKQKLKRLYGIQERPMRNVFQLATRMKGITGENLLALIERRLDNVVYRIGFASSRKEARQLVKHKHFTINGKKANVPSMKVDKGDIIELVKGSRESAKLVGALEANAMREVPAWIEVDKHNFKGIIRDLPKRDDITSKIEERLVVELYGK